MRACRRRRRRPHRRRRSRTWSSSERDLEEREDKPVRVVKPARAPDADDHLAAYFRQLAEHELLTPEDERELSPGHRGHRDPDVGARARRVRTSCVRCSRSSSRTSSSRSQFPKLYKVRRRDAASRSARARTRKLVKKLASAAKEAAAQLRTLDLDRVHIDAVVRELYRAREAATRGRRRRGGSRAARARMPARTSTTFARRIATRRTCATSSCARTCASSSRWRVATTAAACRSPI